MVTRVLEPAEWPRLAETDSPLAEAVPFLVPDDTRIVVVEDDAGAIVATWAAIRYVHVEGLWVDPAQRGRLAGRMLAKMREVAWRWGAKAVLTASFDSTVTRLITRWGGNPLPGVHFVLPIEGPRCQLPFQS